MSRRLKPRTAWRTITFAVPPQDYARLSAIVARDGTRYSTLARESVQSYLSEIELHAESGRPRPPARG